MSMVVHNLVFATVLVTGSVLLMSCSAANDPQAAFKARCGRCHGLRDIQSWGQQRSDTAARQAWLEQFLRLHYPPREFERALIINYIQSTIAGQPAPH